MKKEISLHVNGEIQKLTVDPGTPLLYVLRNDLELNGPKFGCGLEQCGACMVLLDGEAQPSCRIPVAGVAAKKIITLEGLKGENGEMHPVKKAFYEEQAAQCGFCLNGMVISTVALLKKHPVPSDAEINSGLDRVLCRCGTHSRIKKALTNAAVKK